LTLTAPAFHAPGLVDTHAHLGLDKLFGDAGGAVQRAEAAGVGSIITIGIDLEQSVRALKIADRFPRVWAAVGVHPHNARDADDRSLGEMERLAGHPRVVGYGEIGLDFHWDLSPRDVQRAVYREQIGLARMLGKPVIIHLRNAYDEGLGMLEAAAPFPRAGVIHCFSGTADDARRALDLGFCLSFPGTVTFKNNDWLRAIVASLPEDRILLETDCPFLAPVPLRGRTNEPSFLVHTAEMVARVRWAGDREKTAAVTTANASRLFGI
jgi:TatD DNase family protein